MTFMSEYIPVIVFLGACHFFSCVYLHIITADFRFCRSANLLRVQRQARLKKLLVT